MRNDKTRQTGSGIKRNKKRLSKNSNKKPFFALLVITGIILGLFLLDNEPEQDARDSGQSSRDRIKSLPYLAWTPVEDSSKSGVTLFDQEKSISGINIFKSDNKPEAYLMDMNGNIIHTWAKKIEEDDTWSNIELTENGDLIVFLNYEKLIKLDWNSNISWISENLGFHHDLTLSDSGNIYALTRKIEYIPELSFSHRTANDYITILDHNQEVEKSLSIAHLLMNTDLPLIHNDIEPDYPRNTALKEFIGSLGAGAWNTFLAKGLRMIEPYYELIFRPKDYFHTNTINIFRNPSHKNSHGLFKEGDVLICIRNQNLIAVVDIEKEEISWSWGSNELEHPHDPIFLDNGNILIFDNGHKRNFSRIIELNPATKEIVWEYKSSPPEEFFSETRGSNQQLLNGNILIADSRNGRAFEVTRDKEIVWDFYNPVTKTVADAQQRATIFRMRRIINPENLPLP